LNKEWILMIPEFAVLLAKDKGSKGDYRGDKKLMAKRKLTFIYLMEDFRSPLREWEALDRREEAMRCAELTEADIDQDVLTALEHYKMMLQYSSRSLITLRAVKKAVTELDSYFETIDFTLTDKKGELLHNPKSIMESIKMMGPMYDSINQFEKRVEEELSADSGIRGSAEKGDKEGKEMVNPLANYNGSVKIGGAKSWASAGDMVKKLERVQERVMNPVDVDGQKVDPDTGEVLEETTESLPE
jgi:hypothetical protein